MRWLAALGLLVLVLPVQAGAVASWEELHALVLAGEVAPVEAALRAAVEADKASTGEPDEQRKLFTLFTNSAPEIEDFLTRWLEERPSSALAMTAVGWHLWKLGWNARGEGSAGDTYPEAMAVFMADHERAFDLAIKAVAADPDLLAASDLMLRLTGTFGNFEVIPVELERVMARHPNRGSLLRVMKSLAPQWGGSPAQVKLLCDRYAPMVASVPGYDAQVCAIDAVYAGGFWDGDQRDEAHQLLVLTSNPVLDYARLDDALAGLGSPMQRVKVLEGVKAERGLTTIEARALDQAIAEKAGPGVLITQDEWKIALGNAVDARRADADLDPFDPLTVNRYVATAMDSEEVLGIKLDAADLTARLKRLLAQVPFTARSWQLLGDLTGRDVAFGAVDLDTIVATEPYFINAVVYSNYDYDMVAALVSGKAWAITDPVNMMNSRDISALSATELQRLDEVVHCPMIRQFRILRTVCMNRGIQEDQCGNFPAGQFPILERLYKVNGRGACQAEGALGQADLAYSPIRIDF